MQLVTVFHAIIVLAVGGLVPAFAQSSQRVEVVNNHCDVLILYQPQEAHKLALVLRDEDHGINYRPDEVILVGAASSRLTLPAGTPFGEEGESIWVLPQSQDADLLHLGVSAERIPFDVFARPFNLRLAGVEGPGDFFSWQASEFGGLSVKMNSRDGLGVEDKSTPIVGSHEHLNWGFSTSGVYRVTFQADGRRVGESTNIVSEPATFVFHVLPLPNKPGEAPRLASPAMTSAGEFVFEMFGTAGSTYRIESTLDFEVWAEVKTITLDGPQSRVAVPAQVPGGGFYRARQL